MEDRFGAPSSLTCPDCGGALWEVQEERVVRYQCHVGHQYAPDVLESDQRDAVDSALWSAVRVLEEQSELKKRLAKRAADSGLEVVSGGFAEGARDAHTQAQRIRSLLFTANTGDHGKRVPGRAPASRGATRGAAENRGTRPARKKARAKRRA